MTPLAGQPVLTAADMCAAKDAAIADRATVDGLMARAGQAIATAIRRLAGVNEILILCGPGNNGGDGYVAARLLREAGLNVRVAALAESTTAPAKAARAAWPGAVERFADAEPAPILVDALFGTGLTRPLDDPVFAGATGEGSVERTPIATKLLQLAQAAHLMIAIDLPSGTSTDDGHVLSEIPSYDITLALGAAKPGHLLQPAAGRCGAVRILGIGVAAASRASVIASPILPTPGPTSHKYTRGMVAIVAGTMPGAARLAGIAAMRAGAGYVLLLGDDRHGLDALVHKPFSPEALTDRRIGALLIGPGLGRDADAATKLDAALATDHALVIDGDALHLLEGDRLTRLAARPRPVILTPHAGEFDALFGSSSTSKIDRAGAAAAQSNAVVVFKGADTVIAAPDGQVRLAEAASPWLSTAGTGDVLAGTIAATLAAALNPLDAAAAGVWLHADAARRLGPAFIADDLAAMIGVARAAL